MNIVIYGSKLPSLIAAAVLARAGNQVYLPIEQNYLNNRSFPINEPGLRDLLNHEYKEGRLIPYHGDTAEVDAELHWIGLESHQYKIAENIISKVSAKTQGNLLFINQSLFGIGATNRLNKILHDHPKRTVIFIPDSLREGRALETFLQPEQLIVGSESSWAIGKISALARVLLGSQQRIKLMTSQEAEFATLALNGMLAMRISYINELANLADSMNIDIETVRDSIAGDSRIGPHFLSPGCGFGGQKFSQNLLLFSEFMREKRRSSLLRTVIDINEQQKETLFRKLWRFYSGNLRKRSVAIWGLAYKPGTSSIDNSPAVATINALLAQGVEVKVHDPMASETIRLEYPEHPSLIVCDTPEEAVVQTDALMVITEWPEYSMRNFQQISSKMRFPLLLDGRNIYDPGEMEEYGFTYIGIGRTGSKTTPTVRDFG